MVKFVLFICFFQSCVLRSSAFFHWFSSQETQYADVEVNTECIEKAKSGDCSFYKCFDERHPCDTHNYALSYGWRYCSKLDEQMHRLTDDGKTFVKNARVCTMGKLLEFYHQDDIVCTEVEEEMKNHHADCEKDNGACNGDMLYRNRQVFMDVYELSRRGFVRFIKFAQKCGGESLNEAMKWLNNNQHKLTSLFSNLKTLLE